MENNINHRLRHFVKGESQHWLPVIKEARLLWCHFIGSTFWPCGYWISHAATPYVNVQIVEEGELIVHTANGKLCVPAGAAVIISPGDYQLEASGKEGVRKRHLGLTGSMCLQHLAALGFEQTTVLSGFDDPLFDREFDTLYNLFKEPNADRIFDCTSQVCKLMFMLGDKIRSRNFPQSFVKAKFFIECRFDKNITVGDISVHSGCSKTTLQHQFKDILGLSPMGYLTELRMKHALQLLEREVFSIKMISDMCGYDNPLYFSNVFKKFYGKSPRLYRKELLSSVPEAIQKNFKIKVEKKDKLC